MANDDLEAFRRQRLAREFHQILLARVEQQLDALLAADRFAPLVAEMSSGVLDPYEAADRTPRRPPARRLTGMTRRLTAVRGAARWRPWWSGPDSPRATGASDSVRW